MIIRKAITGAGWGATVRPDTMTIYQGYLYIYDDGKWYSIGNQSKLIETDESLQARLNELTGQS